MALLHAIRDTLLPLAVVFALAVVGFGAGIGGVAVELFWIVYGVMWFVSLAAITYWRRESRRPRDRGPDPVYALQQRYATGELSEAEFEAALDRLLGDSRLVRVRERFVGSDRAVEVERN